MYNVFPEVKAVRSILGNLGSNYIYGKNLTLPKGFLAFFASFGMCYGAT